MLIRYPLHNILRSQFHAAHLKIENNVLVALGEAAQQANRHVLVIHLSADVENFIAMMHHIATFYHLHTEQLSLQKDPACFL